MRANRGKMKPRRPLAPVNDNSSQNLGGQFVEFGSICDFHIGKSFVYTLEMCSENCKVKVK